MLTQTFMYDGAQVRTVLIHNQPHWVAKDVCEILGYANLSETIKRLDEDEVNSTEVIDSLGRKQLTNVITESGLYSLILGSRKPEARAFKRWITHEVLPQIRKTGTYSVTPLYVLPQTMSEALRMLADEMESKTLLEAENQFLTLQSSEQKQKLKEQEQPVAIYNLAIKAGNTLSMQEVAKSLGTGRTKLYDFLREKQIVMKNSTLPYQRYLDAGYFKVTERPRASGDTIVNDPATRVTAKGFDYIARLLTAN